ncbi:MAG: uroporphyrinogen-III synthase [Mariprofundaceae bacterium]|nr:uroporphyrinogen-III synthase [Mariprofundaceae bacterium]
MSATTSWLNGQCVLVTRATHQYPALAQLIQQHGGTALSLPCLSMEPLPQQINEGLLLCQQVSDVLFTSGNAVAYVEQQLQESGSSLATTLQNKRVAAIGEKTATLLQRCGVHVEVIPDKQQASQHGLLQHYQQHGLPDSLLFFRADEGNDALQHGLMAAGITVHLVKAYRTVCPAEDDTARMVRTRLQQGSIDAVLLASSKTAQHYVKRIGDVALADIPSIVVISLQVATAAEQLGLHINAIAETPNFPSMLKALA